MMVEDMIVQFMPLVGIGFLVGCFPLLFGLMVQALINILKKF